MQSSEIIDKKRDSASWQYVARRKGETAGSGLRLRLEIEERWLDEINHDTSTKWGRISVLTGECHRRRALTGEELWKSELNTDLLTYVQ